MAAAATGRAGDRLPPRLRTGARAILPGISGFEALRVLREDPSTKDIPVIALTAAAAERERQRGLQAGFYRYLTKPVKVDELIAALEALFAQKS